MVSLEGWEESEDMVNTIIGYEVENLLPRVSSPNTNNFREVFYNCPDNFSQAIEGSADSHFTKTPAGYLSQNSTTVTPLKLKELENIMSTVIACYNSKSRQEQFDISNLAIQFQEMITFESSSSKVVSSYDGLADVSIQKPKNATT